MDNCFEQEFRTPSGSEYDSSVERSIRRRQHREYNNGTLIAGSQYTIGKMTYKVRSFFNIENSKSSEEGLKRLMAQEIDKVSWTIANLLDFQTDLEYCVGAEIHLRTHALSIGLTNERRKN